ncbi:hypothetical protein SKAU_G00027010 [Synaphobranchus kaupii]|uniref:Uncharacterized protein n=1 Tax=Synaphobranchus kaupii TaxID=118154 RepID=A0A9Q1GDX6_SYNKA|nr:hypothetical protein SKAU_G00027010 [Synaphobranchus kaupii]
MGRVTEAVSLPREPPSPLKATAGGRVPGGARGVARINHTPTPRSHSPPQPIALLTFPSFTICTAQTRRGCQTTASYSPLHTRAREW